MRKNPAIRALHMPLPETTTASHHVTGHLVHTGHDAEHLGPDDDRKDHSARREVPARPTMHMPLPESTTSVAAISQNTVLLVHTGHDDEHLRPGDDEEKTARGASQPAKPSTARNTVLHVHTNHDAWKLRPADERRSKPARNMPLPM